jgi:hypothetical protein
MTASKEEKKKKKKEKKKVKRLINKSAAQLKRDHILSRDYSMETATASTSVPSSSQSQSQSQAMARYSQTSSAYASYLGGCPVEASSARLGGWGTCPACARWVAPHQSPHFCHRCYCCACRSRSSLTVRTKRASGCRRTKCGAIATHA